MSVSLSIAAMALRNLIWKSRRVLTLPLQRYYYYRLIEDKLKDLRTIGRDSEALPAFRIIPSPDAEHHHLPPAQGYKYRLVRHDESLNTTWFLWGCNKSVQPWRARKPAPLGYLFLLTANPV